MKYLITGKNGQLAGEFIKSLTVKGIEFTAMSHAELDISDTGKVIEIFESVKPEIVINTAAFNHVDLAEKRYHEAFKTNALGVKNLAYASRRYNAFLIHFSTDYVFNGKKREPYTEEDEPDPANEYGKSKYIGELFLMEEISRYLIFRLSWVYGDGKQNFIAKLDEWLKKDGEIKIAIDEVSVPTWTKTVVDVTLRAIHEGVTGLYHLTSSGYASRYEWAIEILKIRGIKSEIKPVSKSIFNLPARRPDFSAMSNRRISEILDIEIPLWKETLREFLISRK